MRIAPWACLALCLTACASPMQTSRILVTSAAGDRLTELDNVVFEAGSATGTVIQVRPKHRKQTIDGIGTSFTESSAFVLAHLDPPKRREVMQEIYGESGADFSLSRTHIASCDFSVKGKYSYAPTPDGYSLEDFSIDADLAGFDPEEYPNLKEPTYDLLPMIHEALGINSDLRIIASAWTAPPWMKDIETWYIGGSPENNWQGNAGHLKPEYEATYADYLLKYLDAYQAAGVPIWGITPVNEPHGNGGHWESMHFSPESQNDFVKQYLGPRLRGSEFADTKLLIFDQNRDGLEAWTDVIFADEETAPYVYGAAIHWYASTFKVFEETLDRVHEKFPDFTMVHTEGCIDNLGNPAPGDGIQDPEGFQESNWFLNDEFWWTPTATDWAYSASWAGPAVADHPMYTPVHRYARNIIVSLDHWVTGWVDWNIVLDRDGGPNHVNNFCGAPIMIDTETQDIHYTPIFYVLKQFSRTIRPGDVAVETARRLGDLDPDSLHACATVSPTDLLSIQLLNTTDEAQTISLQIGERYAPVLVPANSVQTVQVQL